MRVIQKVKTMFFSILVLSLVIVVSCGKDDEPKVDQDQLAYDAADAIRGGQLYDKFWNVESYTGPSDASVNQDDISGYSDFYRCKQCHGWDLRGNEAWYINRAPKTTRPDVSDVALVHMRTETDLRDIYDEIAHVGGAAVDPARTADGTNASLGGNNMPDYSKILTESQIWDLVKFLKEGAYDTRNFYDLATTGTYPNGTKTMTNLGKDGNATAGDTFYTNNCASCHGTEGKTIALDDMSLGDFVRGKAHESQHKIKNGHPGSSMGGLPNATETDVKNLLKAIANDTKYPAM